MKRSKHQLSHYKLFTGDMGQLIPIGLQEVLPGDTFQHSTNLMVRMSPMAAPVMHPIDVRVHHFYVPNRIVWDGWEDFITGGADGNDISTVPTTTVNTDTYATNVFDYLGVPLINGMEVNALPLWGYNKIFNEYFRDQDLVAEYVDDHQNVKHIAWEKDNFTSARPWEQKGDAISLPIGGQAAVLSNGLNPLMDVGGLGESAWNQGTDGSGLSFMTTGTDSARVGAVTFGSETGLTADLGTASQVTVNEFRRAFALQRYQEARARYGSRYTEYLRYLGIKSSDARLQRPEYLGGGRQTVSISEVLQTAPEGDQGQPPGNTDYGVGDMYGHGIAAMRSNKYRRFFEEHGYVISLMSVRPKAMYVNGIDRHFLKTDKEDYFQKELHYVGQQPVLNGEVYVDGTPDDRATFGYQDRYVEYKRGLSRVAGEFRDLQNYWHLGREFEARPVLNSSFVECDPSKRIFNEQSQHSLWCMAQHKIVARRIVPRTDASRIV